MKVVSGNVAIFFPQVG